MGEDARRAVLILSFVMSFSLSTTNKFGCARVASARPATAKRTVSRVVRRLLRPRTSRTWGCGVMNLLPSARSVAGDFFARWLHFFVPPR